MAGGQIPRGPLLPAERLPIALPPLRERAEDIPLLGRHFLDDAAREYDLPAPEVTPDAMELLSRYRWPGNVRQLRAQV